MEQSESARKKVRLVVERMQHSADAYSDKRSDWNTNFKTYLAMRDDPTYPWESNLVMPAVFDAVETHLPHVVAEDMTLKAIPRLNADPEYVETMDAMLAYDCDRMDLSWRLVPTMKQALVFGVSPVYLGWVTDIREQKVREWTPALAGTPHEFMAPVTSEQMIVRHDGPYMVIPDVHSVYPQPGKWLTVGAPQERMSWLVWRFTVPFKYMEQLNAQGVLVRGALKRIKESAYPSFLEQEAWEMQERAEILGVDISKPDETMREVEILAMFGDRGENAPDGMMWVANRTVLARDEGPPFYHGDIPFQFINDIPLPHDLNGLGEAQILQTYQDEKSDLRNARLDNIHLIVNRMWKRMMGSGIDPNQLLSRPGGVVDVQSMNHLEPIQHADVPFSTYQDEELLQGDIERTAGQLDVLRGERLGGNRSSATENELLAEFAAARVRIKLMSLKQGLRQIGRWMIALEQQFMTDQRIVRLAGPGRTVQDFLIDPQNIVGEWDVMPIVDQRLPLTKIRRREELRQMMEMLAPYIGQYIAPDALLEEVLEAYGFKDTGRFLVSAQQARAAAVDPAKVAREAVDQSAVSDLQVLRNNS